ncbi:MAG TPA: hypothetical protein VK426_09670 [Methanobacterium sp.]|nr:hypothetical protein [Methanobacterium sp.]
MFAGPSAAAEHGIGAYNVKVTSEYVMATGVCSCSLCTNRYHHTRVFYNKDPLTGHKGVLYFEQGPSSWTSPEGLWVAGDTDMDFCLVHGKSHDSRGVFLIPYNGVINGYVVKNGYFTKQKVSTVNTTQNTTSNVTQNQVQAKSVEEGFIEIVIDNQTYTFNKEELGEFKQAMS